MPSKKEISELYRIALSECSAAKLSYLKSADKQHLPEYKRFLNLQATVRNGIYNELLRLLETNVIDSEELFIQKLNREEIMISTLAKEKQNAFTKAIATDESLLNRINQIRESEHDLNPKEEFARMIAKLKNSLSINEVFEVQSQQNQKYFTFCCYLLLFYCETTTNKNRDLLLGNAVIFIIL